MRSKAVALPFLSINGGAMGDPLPGVLPSAVTIYVGLHPEFALKRGLLSHNHWTLTHIPVQTDKEFEI